MTDESSHYPGEAFARQFGPWALVAGASDGTGEAYARELARRGLDVVLLARRAEMLDRLAHELSAEHGVRTATIVADLTDPAIGELVERGLDGREIGLLVINAGAVHGAAHFLDRPLDQVLSLVALNCGAPTTLAHQLGGPMRARGRGGIVIMSSMAMAAGSAFNATYCAAKAYEVILAEALWSELQPLGVDVMSVIAGATDTPSMHASVDGWSSYDGVMDPTELVLGALDHLGAGPSYVPGENNRAGAQFLWPGSRVQLSQLMSQATAEMYGLAHVPATGKDYFD
ncbi:SDR family NAD(P)-dependent oxidoreductase [soil metagenome]